MKNLIFITLFAVAMISCNNNQKTSAPDQSSENKLSASAGDIKVFELDQLLEAAEQQIDQTVQVTGYVVHTCKHSGKRCFITGEDQKASMRIEAKGNIGGFNRELVGSKIKVTGTLKERRISQEYIDQMEKDVAEKQVKEDGSAESCQAELKNINEMREWMKSHNKEYYSIFYLDGQDYETLE